MTSEHKSLARFWPFGADVIYKFLESIARDYHKPLADALTLWGMNSYGHLHPRWLAFDVGVRIFIVGDVEEHGELLDAMVKKIFVRLHVSLVTLITSVDEISKYEN